MKGVALKKIIKIYSRGKIVDGRYIMYYSYYSYFFRYHRPF